MTIDEAITLLEANGYHVTKPRPRSRFLTKPRPQRKERPLGLNAVGKPYSPQYDPKYKLRYKPSYGHLRLPYPKSMRFVGDAPPAAEGAP